jgi:hypothetical protein
MEEWRGWGGVGTGGVSAIGQRQECRCAAKTYEKKSDAHGADVTQNFSPLYGPVPGVIMPRGTYLGVDK